MTTQHRTINNMFRSMTYLLRCLRFINCLESEITSQLFIYGKVNDPFVTLFHKLQYVSILLIYYIYNLLDLKFYTIIH